MPPYAYSKLDSKNHEIRLVTLLPGEFIDPIRITIAHQPFIVESEKRRPIPTLPTEEHRKSLPPGWYVFETLEGRWIYNYMNDEDGSDYSSWTHPDPSVPIEKSYEEYFVEMQALAPSYEALSYHWDSADDPVVAYVEESATVFQKSSSQVTLQLRRNLASALKFLRYTDRPRTLWIDAICINQKDFAEREEQVLRMGSIYNYATRVVAWLGESTNDSEIAMSALRDLGSTIEATRDRVTMPSPDNPDERWHPNTKLPYDDKLWQSIYSLLSRPWFQRVWVMQEIQLSNPESIVMCGHESISWYLLRRSIICLRHKQYATPLHLKAYNHIILQISELCWNRLDQSLPHLLFSNLHRECSEPVDKLYGILSLAPASITNRIRPNYLLSAEEVYKKAFLEHIDIVNRLELFGSCNSQNKQMNIPSWVPDLSSQVTIWPMWRMGYSASGLSSSSVHYESPDILDVLGIRCSTVDVVSHTLIQTEADVFASLPSFETLAGKTYVTGQSLLDAYVWTITMGGLKERFATTAYLATLQQFKGIFYEEEKETDHMDEMTRSRFPMLSQLMGHRLFTTQEGYIGLGRESTMPGVYSGMLE